MKWVTRERVRMDRVACAWLIKNFIDKDAEFQFVSPQDAPRHAHRDDAIPFVLPGADLARKGERITLDAMLDTYHLTDPALAKLAEIVRAADIRGLAIDAPEADGVRAIVHGFFLLNLPDAEALERQYPLFDALYRYCQEQVARPAEGHAAS